ncbi:MAG: [FeFe] hydrogenase H-cluster maturation GTPase HydF [Lentisphaerae bacterium]|nr:[FeFe] hydrogenase H-cluster maturation GTPase HydF [Lentisphaerota bacterium]
MSLNQTPTSERIHIAIFGRRNVGKSSLINAITGQEVAIVSPVKGTTTDPVGKAMELPPLGPVVFFDTPGIDDSGEIGSQRVRRSHDILNKTDIAIIVTEASITIGKPELEIIELLQTKKIPLLIAFNKSDLTPPNAEQIEQAATISRNTPLALSAQTGSGVDELKSALTKLIPDNFPPRPLVSDLLKPLDLVVLVTPIDAAAPKGRLILPQQQVIRDILDSGAIALAVREHEFAAALQKLAAPPQLVITDSQVFGLVAAATPRHVPLTSFSIIFARYKGDLNTLVQGARAVASLKDGDRILIAEGCTHHRQTDDIGTVKIPRWIRQHTGKKLTFEHFSGAGYPLDLNTYALIIHCGACTLNRREMQHRLQRATAAGIPIVNYGVVIAYTQGILERCLEPFTAPSP